MDIYFNGYLMDGFSGMALTNKSFIVIAKKNSKMGENTKTLKKNLLLRFFFKIAVLY
jgi:hypothetical protein